MCRSASRTSLSSRSSCTSAVACSVNHRLRFRTSDISSWSTFTFHRAISHVVSRLSSLSALLIVRVTQDRNISAASTKLSCFVPLCISSFSISISTFCKVDLSCSATLISNRSSFHSTFDSNFFPLQTFLQCPTTVRLLRAHSSRRRRRRLLVLPATKMATMAKQTRPTCRRPRFLQSLSRRTQTPSQRLLLRLWARMEVLCRRIVQVDLCAVPRQSRIRELFTLEGLIRESPKMSSVKSSRQLAMSRTLKSFLTRM